MKLASYITADVVQIEWLSNSTDKRDGLRMTTEDGVTEFFELNARLESNQLPSARSRAGQP